MFQIFYDGWEGRSGPITNISEIFAVMALIEDDDVDSAPEFSLSSQQSPQEDYHHFPIMHLIYIFPVNGNDPKWTVRFVAGRNESFLLARNSNNGERVDCMVCGAPESVCRVCMLDATEDRALLEAVFSTFWRDESRIESAEWIEFLAAMISV